MCDIGNENNPHRDLFGLLGNLPILDLLVLDNEAVSNILLFSDDKLNIVSNRMS